MRAGNCSTHPFSPKSAPIDKYKSFEHKNMVLDWSWLNDSLALASWKCFQALSLDLFILGPTLSAGRRQSLWIPQTVACEPWKGSCHTENLQRRIANRKAGWKLMTLVILSLHKTERNSCPHTYFSFAYTEAPSWAQSSRRRPLRARTESSKEPHHWPCPSGHTFHACGR